MLSVTKFQILFHNDDLIVLSFEEFCCRNQLHYVYMLFQQAMFSIERVLTGIFGS